jgi:hypothetical protein
MSDLLSCLNEMLPIYETTLPFSKQKVFFKPFKVKDAKAIGIILQEDDKKLALKAMVELIKNNSPECDVLNLCLADAEFLFLQIRSKSVDEVLHLVKNNEKIQINISEIKHRNCVKTEKIDIGNNISIFLKTPIIKDLLKLDKLDKEELFKSAIEKIIVKNEIYNFNKFITDEIKTALDNLPLSVVPKIDKFLKEQPELYVNLKFNSSETEVSGLLNFFIFR